jgi:lipopolysaccharide export system permease protein
MEKIIFKKLYSEILRVFLIILFSLSILIWLLQAVNLLDIISEDGHGVDVYFQYTLLNLPKIISKAYLLSYFLALFYVISKYEETNQLLIFWTFGIKKITFLNKLLKISFLFFIFSFILYFLISPYTQNKSRSLIKSSDLDFFTSLIKQKTFIDTVQGLTFFVNDKNNNQIQNIILKDATNPNKIQIILAEKGKIINNLKLKNLILLNGKIINSNNDKKLSVINFQETTIDLKNYQTKTTTTEKIQELSSSKILKCVLNSMNINFSLNHEFMCNKLINKEYYKELYKRFILPLFVILIAPIVAFITLKSGAELNYKFYKYLFFSIGIFFIVISEISLSIISNSILSNLIVILLYPIIFSLLILLFKNQNKVNI